MRVLSEVGGREKAVCWCRGDPFGHLIGEPLVRKTFSMCSSLRDHEVPVEGYPLGSLGSDLAGRSWDLVGSHDRALSREHAMVGLDDLFPDYDRLTADPDPEGCHCLLRVPVVPRTCVLLADHADLRGHGHLLARRCCVGHLSSAKRCGSPCDLGRCP